MNSGAKLIDLPSKLTITHSITSRKKDEIKSWSNDRSNQFGAVCADHSLTLRAPRSKHFSSRSVQPQMEVWKPKKEAKRPRTKLNGGSED